MEIIKIIAISIAVMDLIALIVLFIFISRRNEIKKLSDDELKIFNFQRIKK